MIGSQILIPVQFFCLQCGSHHQTSSLSCLKYHKLLLFVHTKSYFHAKPSPTLQSSLCLEELYPSPCSMNFTCWILHPLNSPVRWFSTTLNTNKLHLPHELPFTWSTTSSYNKHQCTWLHLQAERERERETHLYWTRKAPFWLKQKLIINRIPQRMVFFTFTGKT